MVIRPRTPYESVTVPVGGGLNLSDSPDDLQPGEVTVMENLRITGIGRASTRLGVGSITSGVSGQVVGIFPYPWGTDASGGVDTGSVYLAYDSGGSQVLFYAADSTGQNAALIDPDGLGADGLVSGWDSGVSSPPRTGAATLGYRLFVVDESKSNGLVIFDGRDGASPKLFQPTFTFDAGPAAPVYARCVASYNNMIFVSGYGSESTGDIDRPEIVRFSFLGLNDDGQGAGDAGSGSSANLFDIDDYFAVGEAGIPVTAMQAVSGRLVITNERATYVLFGFNRDSFKLDLVDPQVGCVATRSMVVASGVAYWWSQLGPARFAGGQVDTNFSRKVRPRVPDIDVNSVFAMHVPSADEVRFYYTEDSITKALCWNYRHQVWRDEVLTAEYFCGGSAREGTGAVSAPPGAPSGVTIDQITTNSFTSSWTPASGLQSGATTTVELYQGSNSATGTLEDTKVVSYSTTSQPWSGLSPDTQYAVKVYHTYNGLDSASDEASATTLSDVSGTPPPPPTDLQVAVHIYYDYANDFDYATVDVSWINGSSGVKTKVYGRRNASLPDPPDSYLKTTTGVDEQSWLDTDPDFALGDTVYYKVSNVDPSSGLESTLTTEVSATIGEA